VALPDYQGYKQTIVAQLPYALPNATMIYAQRLGRPYQTSCFIFLLSCHIKQIFFTFAKSTMMNWKPFWTLIYLFGKERVASTRCD
jgi:hypothetical protein